MAADEKSGHTLGQGPRSGDVGGSRNASMVAMPAPVAVSRRNGDVDVASVDRRRPRGPGPMAGGANPLAALLASLGGGVSGQKCHRVEKSQKKG
jgi:hypothetical protein